MTRAEAINAILNERDVWVKTKEGSFVGPLRILSLEKVFVGYPDSPKVAMLSNGKTALLNTIFFNNPDTAIISDAHIIVNTEEKTITYRGQVYTDAIEPYDFACDACAAQGVCRTGGPELCKIYEASFGKMKSNVLAFVKE